MTGTDARSMKKTVKSMLTIRMNKIQIMRRKTNTLLISRDWFLQITLKIFLFSMKSIFLLKTSPKRKIRKNKSIQTKQSERYVHPKTKIKKTCQIELQAKNHLVIMVIASMMHKTCQKFKVRSRNWSKETRETDKLKNRSKNNDSKFSKFSKDKTVFSWCKSINRTS